MIRWVRWMIVDVQVAKVRDNDNEQAGFNLTLAFISSGRVSIARTFCSDVY